MMLMTHAQALDKRRMTNTKSYTCVAHELRLVKSLSVYDSG